MNISVTAQVVPGDLSRLFERTLKIAALLDGPRSKQSKGGELVTASSLKGWRELLGLLLHFIFCVFLISSCIGGGPQLNFDRGDGGPAGGPGPGVPLPSLTSSLQFMASGGGFYESERFSAFGVQTSIDGGRAFSPSYRMVSAALGLGQQGIIGPIPAPAEKSP